MVDMETLLFVTLAYMIGVISVMLFTKVRTPDGPKAFSDYERRLREYEDMLVDLKIGLDTLEIRTSDKSRPASQIVSQPAGDAGHKPMAIRRTLQQEGGGMLDYVLKLLVEGPKRSREIEGLIGRSREHTARVMKKLFEMNYVTRDTTSKPYTYAITDSGRTALPKVGVSA